MTLLQLFVIVVLLFCVWFRWQMRHMIKFSKLHKNNLKSIPIVGHSYIFLTCKNNSDQWKCLESIGREAVNQGGVTVMWSLQKMYFISTYFGLTLLSRDLSLTTDRKLLEANPQLTLVTGDLRDSKLVKIQAVTADHSPPVVVADPIVAESVMKQCLEKDDAMKIALAAIGDGSNVAEVPIWRPRRKILSSTFTPRNLKTFTTVFSKQSEIMVQKLHKVAGTGNLSIFDYLIECAVDIVCETSLGINPDARVNSNQKLIKALSECFTLVSERIMKPWLQNELLYSLTPQYRRFMVNKETIRNHISEIIRIRRKEYEQNIKKGDSDKDRLRTFMELMIESSGVDAGYDDKELLSEIVVVITAATDTSSVGSAFTCVLLARHPDIQEKVYKEIKEVFIDSEPVTFEKLAELKYMSAVIMESLRLYPPAPNVVRKVDRDVILPSGDTLPKATAIMLSIFAANRNPRYWGDDAEEFRPERFMGSSLKHHSAFLSFSSGPRNCVGYRYGMLSMKAALTNILRNFRLLPISEQDLGKPMNLESDLMLRDTDGFQVKLEPRA